MPSTVTDTINASVRIAQWVRSAGDDDGYVLLDIRRGLYHSVDGVSARIWGHLREGYSAAETAARVAELYGVDPERVRDDVRRFIGQLERKGLVHIDA